jgi:hypothetical protein
LLYCGTERGINVSFDDGVSWQPLESNLPITPIWDLVVKDTDLVVATHGRSFWILDDITPLHQLQPEVALAAAHLFKPRDSIRFRLYARGEGKSKNHLNYKMTGPVTVAYRQVETPSGAKVEQFVDAGANPPEGVLIHYWLRDAVKPENVKLSILDAAGKEIRSFNGKPDKTAAVAEPTEGEIQQVTGEEEVSEEEPTDGPWAPTTAGMHRFVWDGKYEKPVKLESKSRSKREEALAGASGPRAIPGEYQVRLSVGEQVLTQPLTLLADPRLPVTQADLQAQFDLKMAIRERSSETHTAINQIRRVREQVEQWEKRAADSTAIKEAARALKDELKAVEGELLNLDFEKPRPGVNRIKEKWDALSSMIDESDHAPTAGAHEFYAELKAQLDTQRRRLKRLIDGPVKAFSELIHKEGVPPIAV